MFTDRQLKAWIKENGLAAGADRTEKLGGRGSGSLMFKVRGANNGEFYFRYHIGKARKTKKLGNYKASKSMAGLTLEEARQKAQELSKIYRDDKDVKAVLEQREEEKARQHKEREAKKLEGSFKDLTNSYINQLKAEGKSSASEVENSLQRSVFKPHPDLAKKKANEIVTEDITAVLRAMIENGITTQSNRVRSYLLAAFNHGLKQENNPRSYLESPVRFNLKYNPVANIPRQTDYERSGESVIPDDEIKHLWHELTQTDKVSFVMASLIRFAFATGGQRIKQILDTPWERYDLEARTMLIHDSKGKGAKVRPHLVPLNDLAMKILEQLQPYTGECRYPFAGGSHNGDPERHIRHDSVPLALQRYRETHEGRTAKAADIRRTCKTIMARSGIAKELRDRLHNHSLNDIATKHYDKHDYLEEKRTAMDQWNCILDLILNPRNSVTLIRNAHKNN